MIPAEVKLALYRIALFCKEKKSERLECATCQLDGFCSRAFDIYPNDWERMRAETGEKKHEYPDFSGF